MKKRYIIGLIILLFIIVSALLFGHMNVDISFSGDIDYDKDMAEVNCYYEIVPSKNINLICLRDKPYEKSFYHNAFGYGCYYYIFEINIEGKKVPVKLGVMKTNNWEHKYANLEINIIKEGDIYNADISFDSRVCATCEDICNNGIEYMTGP